QEELPSNCRSHSHLGPSFTPRGELPSEPALCPSARQSGYSVGRLIASAEWADRPIDTSSKPALPWTFCPKGENGFSANRGDLRSAVPAHVRDVDRGVAPFPARPRRPSGLRRE